MDVSVSVTIDQETYLKKIRGASGPLTLPGSACGRGRGGQTRRQPRASKVRWASKERNCKNLNPSAR